jgi:hypothetical protein
MGVNIGVTRKDFHILVLYHQAFQVKYCTLHYNRLQLRWFTEVPDIHQKDG